MSTMDEGTASETVPDLRDIEVKIGRKTPEGLLRWMREEASAVRGDAKVAAAHDASKDAGKKSLDEKIRKLKVEMAHLRSVDVKILQQLLAVHEGIEAVKWLLEERSTLTSRCSSLTSSQYSLGEGPDTSWRGSWSSLQDPNDKLDNISVGSYLDTLADDMDEYCPSSSDSVICSSTPVASEATVGARTGGGTGAVGLSTGAGAKSGTVGAGTGAGVGMRAGAGGTGIGAGGGTEVRAGHGTGATSAVTGSGISGTAAGTGTTSPAKPAVPGGSPQAKSEGPKQDIPIWTKAPEMGKGSPVSKENTQTQAIKTNGVLEKPATQTGGPDSPRSCLSEKLGINQSPKLKPYKNGKIDLETCKMNGKMHLEYDAHWRWVQSQEDVTFL
ncbi:leucine rich adaptor protein 1 [Myripristis murdjan]|uniref:leucine rich adaptor protein 1 n=1 Tax=Myripristis murdjan TaxID=586833 RepID=UPI001175E69D|nr:leucine rich adaptor protein 1-like [Myripristis murdjan]